MNGVQPDTEQLLQAARLRVQERAALAALPRARLLSSSIELTGSAVARLQVRRLTVGDPVERPFSRSFGVTRCVTTSADVRELWERLLGFEAASGDTLRGRPATVLDIPGGTAALQKGGLLITAGSTATRDDVVVAIPRFLYDCPARKLNNFGHWLLDCAPQVAVLQSIAPDALVLLPPDPRRFHHATLEAFGVARARQRPWDGSPMTCSRILAFESDGRMGGGRPLSPLMEVRRRLAARAGDEAARRGRRIYVSRRDAGTRRQWVVNEPEVEALFRSRGFEIVVMADCPLDEQMRMFREARIVAGVSGAGLTDLVFSAPGIDVIVLVSDPHIRWYADETGARSLWSAGRREGGAELAAFGDSPRFYAHLAAAFGQVCHSFVGTEHMPIDHLTAFLDEVLAAVGRA